MWDDESCSIVVVASPSYVSAIFVHPAIGYTDWWHLTPAVAGAAAFVLGWWLTLGTHSDAVGGKM